MSHKRPTLYIFSGLPACGKTTLAEKLAPFSGAVFLRIDTVEQALRDLCSYNVTGEGYRLSYRIAHDNLKLGLNVIADSCNPIFLTRNEWQDVADSSRANYEIICTDKLIHKNRVESRVATIKNLKLPTWKQVETLEYHTWNSHHHIIDTANKTVEDSFTELLKKIQLSGNYRKTIITI